MLGPIFTINNSHNNENSRRKNVLLTSAPTIKAPGFQHYKELKEINYIKNLDIFRKAPFPEHFQILIAYFIAIS